MTTRRQFLRRSGALAAAGVVSPLAIQRALAAASDASFVLRNGAVLTFDARKEPATCVAVRDDLIVYVGTDAGAADLIGPTTEVIDLKGRTVMPGIQDAHMHPLSAGQSLAQCSLGYLQLTLDEMRDRITVCLKQTEDEEPKGWLRVRFWDYQAIQPAGTVPTKADLDVLDTARPILVHSLDGHTALANSRALEIAGVTAATPDPPDGEIIRDASGEPTGVLEDSAVGLVGRHIPAPSVEQNARALRAAIRKMNRLGITSFMNASSDEASLASAASLRDAGRLTARAQYALTISAEELEDPATVIASLEAKRSPHVGGLLTAPTVKLFLDGVIEAPTHTAALLKPYRENTGTDEHPHWEPGDTRGPTYFDPEVANPGVAALDAAGWQVHTHAIGDRAVRTALDAFEHAADANGATDNRHTVAHVELVHPDDLGRFAELGVLACMQMQWAELDSYTVDYTKPYIGARRWRYLYPSGSIADEGGMVTGGSDWPVDPLIPFRQIEMAVNREGDEIYPHFPGPLHAQERIRRRASLRMHTANSAYQMHQLETTGTIEVGKKADVIVLDRDVERVPLTDVSTTEVLLTLLDGVAVHRSKHL
ncbi:MAG: amidohydrolase [Actinomycetota bacterium]